MAKEVVEPAKDFVKGESIARAVVVPLKTGTVFTSIQKLDLPNLGTTVFRARQLFSGDGGVTWVPGAWMTWDGRPRLNRLGQLVTEETITSSVYYPPGKKPDPMHDPDNPLRRMGVEIEAVEPVKIALSMECVERNLAKEFLDAQIKEGLG